MAELPAIEGGFDAPGYSPLCPKAQLQRCRMGVRSFKLDRPGLPCIKSILVKWQ
jgi:hypothetical protein